MSPTAHPDVVVQTHQLTKQFGDFTALDGLSIEVGRGQILGFIGPNGAGKTTTIRILVGLLRPSSGSARIGGADCVSDAARIKHMVGYMPDVFGSYDNMRVWEYLDFFGATYRIPLGERRKRIDAVLETANATYMKDMFVESLSHGMKQRVGIARTLLHDPQVLILDEPANGLDPQARIEMRGLLLKLADMGKTLIVTSHILPELSRVCNVVAIITQGKLRAFGSLDEIMQRLRQRRTFELLLVDPSQLDTATTALRDSLASEVDSQLSASAAENVVRFQTSFSDDELADVLASLIAQGIRVGQFRELQSDLEDAFLSITGSEDAEQPPVVAAVSDAVSEVTP